MNFSMNSAMNAMNAVGNAVGKIAANGAPADQPLASDGALLPGAGQALPQPALQVLPFQHWIGADGAQPPVDAAAPIDGAVPEAGLEPGTEEPADETLAAEQAVAIDAVLAAMTPQVAPAALPAMMLAMAGTKPGAANDGAAPAAIGLAAVTDAATVREGQPASAARAVADVPVQPLPAAAPAAQRADAVAAQPLPPTPAAPAAPATSAAVDGAQPESADKAPTTGAAGVAANQPAAARGNASVVLAGPPTAWRQTLHEALGERLQLQAGRGVEQATIRLEPPMLGRIDISVRHSGGNLEVHIAASNTDVLRQLNTVSDSLRNDLAGRQYSNVSVSVSEAPRAQASAQAGNQPSGQPGADAQGRGRQQEQDDQRQRTPGLALNDAGDAGSLFSMNDRD